MTIRTLLLLTGSTVLGGATALAQDGAPAAPANGSSSLMAQAIAREQAIARAQDRDPNAALTLFAVEPPRPREFQRHDLVQIIVRESSEAKSSQELETSKEWDTKGGINAWPSWDLADLLELRLAAGNTTPLPEVDVSWGKEFAGEGEYERTDDFTARLTAEIIEVLPNGNLVLEARTYIKVDEEEATMSVTGVCRSLDITAANTVLSSQIHDLKILKSHEGELKDANRKGVIARVLDAIFAF